MEQYYNFRITYLHICIMLKNHEKKLAGIVNSHMNNILHRFLFGILSTKCCNWKKKLFGFNLKNNKE